MARKVIYFTRTGTCKRIAQQIAGRLSLEIVEIKDNHNWNGFIGYWTAGFYASTQKEVEISINGEVSNADEFILVTPVWAGSITPAVKAFIKKYPRNQVILVVSSNGSRISDRADFISVFDIPKSEKNEETVLSDLINYINH